MNGGENAKKKKSFGMEGKNIGDFKGKSRLV